MRLFARRWTLGLPGILLLFLYGAAWAQGNQDIVGAYDGEIAGKQATLHLRVRPDGTLTATLDHLDAAAPWMFTCADVHRDGQSLSFKVPSIHVSFEGKFAQGANALSGSWTQNANSLLLTFMREAFVPAAKPSALDGIWLGTQQIGNDPASRVQVMFRSDAGGREYCTVDALDIYSMDLECGNVVFSGNAVSFTVPVAGMQWRGTLEADGNALSGESHVRLAQSGGSTQDVSEPLNLKRQEKPALEKARRAAVYDAAIAPVSAEQLEPVLRADLAEALASGELASATGQGVSIGVYAQGRSRVFALGAAKADSIYEIGSITKVFTGLVLAQMAEQHEVQLDEPVRALLSPGSVARPAGAEITLMDLATQSSGLPAMPDNISVANLEQPYADYHFADLMAYVGRHGVANATHEPSSFSSLGWGLLGAALANAAHVSYGELVQREITTLLGMRDTGTMLSAEQQARFVPGHDQFHGPAQPWESDALAGAVGLRSSAGDMLAFLIANLHPEQVKAESGTLAAAIHSQLEPRAELSSGMRIAFGWLYEGETGNYWHNGATAAHSAYAFFNPRGDFAAVILFNGSPGVNGSFAENLGRHVYQRLAGKPALAMRP
jgi:serine-type D-Ala-D-Ala carboxypeptidase/endopeptidase